MIVIFITSVFKMYLRLRFVWVLGELNLRRVIQNMLDENQTRVSTYTN